MTDDTRLRDLRTSMGLNLPLMAQLLHATDEEVLMLAGRTKSSADLLKRANALHRTYTKWRDGVLNVLNAKREVSPRELSQLLHLSAWAVHTMSYRGRLTARLETKPPDSRWRSVARKWFSSETVQSAFEQNETELKDVNDDRRTGIFGHAFAQYITDQVTPTAA